MSQFELTTPFTQGSIEFFHRWISHVVEVKQVSCYAISLHAMFSMVQSHYSRFVVRFNSLILLCVSYVTLSSMFPMFILDCLLYSNSLVLPGPCLTTWFTLWRFLKGLYRSNICASSDHLSLVKSTWRDPGSCYLVISRPESWLD